MHTLLLLLFDDIKNNRERAASAIESSLGQLGTLLKFEPLDSDVPSRTMYEVAIADWIRRLPSPPDLIVADRDLSSYTAFNGLSEQAVQRAADALGIPVCGYARGDVPMASDFVDSGKRQENCIRLQFEPANIFAAKVIDIAQGFVAIQSALSATASQPGRSSPGKQLASILGKPRYAEKLSLYAAGDSGRLDDIEGIRKAVDQDKQRRTARLLGYWLWDSVLRFPGVLVNEAAAASLLNIDPAQFSDSGVKELFDSARYSGPFSLAAGNHWWRADLQEIVSGAGHSDGRTFASEALNRQIDPCPCSVNPQISAGYYCVLTKRPISMSESVGNLSWIPRGADLARVSNQYLQEIGPWL